MNQLTIYIPQELSQSSYVHTGLFELQKRGELNLDIKLCLEKQSGRLVFDTSGNLSKNNKPHPKTCIYKLLDNKTGALTTFAIDLYDHANDFSNYALNKCDLYFKRNYESKYVDKLPKTLKAKCLPFSLSFRVTTPDVQSNFKIKWGYALVAFSTALKFDRFLVMRAINVSKAIKLHLNNHKANRALNQFENYNLNIKNNTILFQTRCFADESNSDILAINKQRYALIHLLREAFPKEFNGGFVPSDLVHKKYKDAITNVPTSPIEYLQFMKQSGIVIYTRGLANSPAWKMAEYLSQGKIIIAEKLTTELPEPLVHGKHLLYFNNDQELIYQIKRVLNDKELALNLSKNARLYFENYVHPRENMKRVLNIVAPKSK